MPDEPTNELEELGEAVEADLPGDAEDVDAEASGDDLDPEEEQKLLEYLTAPTPDVEDIEDEEEPLLEELHLSAEDQLQAYLDAGVPLSALALVTAGDGRLISCERAIL